MDSNKHDPKGNQLALDPAKLHVKSSSHAEVADALKGTASQPTANVPTHQATTIYAMLFHNAIQLLDKKIGFSKIQGNYSNADNEARHLLHQYCATFAYTKGMLDTPEADYKLFLEKIFETQGILSQKSNFLKDLKNCFPDIATLLSVDLVKKIESIDTTGFSTEDKKQLRDIRMIAWKKIYNMQDTLRKKLDSNEAVGFEYTQVISKKLYDTVRTIRINSTADNPLVKALSTILKKPSNSLISQQDFAAKIKPTKNL